MPDAAGRRRRQRCGGVLGRLAARPAGTPGRGRRVPRRADARCTYFTFRPGPARRRRGRPGPRVHPMVGRRLQPVAAAQLRITRLEAPEDVLLYHCVAPDNPADERLVALAQVRELTVVRDDDGHVVVAAAGRAAPSPRCLEAIRRARTARGAAGTRLDMNRVFLHIWPVVDAPLEELAGLQRSARAADGGRRDRGGRGAGPHRWRRTAPCSRRRDPVLLPGRVRGRRVVRRRADRAARAAGRLRAEGAARAPPRHRLPLRAAADARRPGRHLRRARPRRRPARWCRSTGRPGSNKAGVVAGVVTTPTAAAPRGHHPGGAARRPDQGAGRGRRAGVRAGDRRPRPGRADAGAGGVVRPVGRRPDLDGLRHREHGLGGRGAARGSSRSPRTAARSTSSSPASTSAPSRTGTPRRRC